MSRPAHTPSPYRFTSLPASPGQTSFSESHTRALPILQYPLLSGFPELFHATFTRHGGQSIPPYRSLNVSPNVGDAKKDVIANLALLKSAIRAKELLFTRQVHGCDILFVEPGQVFGEGKPVMADAIITKAPGIAIMVMQADCQGVILYDPENRAVATVHCGWKGQVQNILSRVITKMQSLFHTKPSRLRAAIAPSLGPCCGEFKGYREIFPESFREFMSGENHFDLWAVSVRQLQQRGVRDENIAVSGICTRCGTERFFSYRGEGRTGRFGTVAMIREAPAPH